MKPGTTLHHALAAYFARDLIQEAVCTYCSLRTTLQQAPVRSAAHSLLESTVSPIATRAAQGGAENSAAKDDRGSIGASIVSRGGEQGDEGSQEAAAQKLVRLQGLLRGSCAAPECDYAQLAADAGLHWEERRGPLLTRATIARAPQVQPFC